MLGLGTGASSASASTFTRWALAMACSSTSLAWASAPAMRASRSALGQRDLLVGLGVGRLAHGGLQPLLLALGLELGHLGLLHDDLLAGGGIGQRAGLLGGGLGLVDLGLVAGLLDLAGPPGLGLQGVGLLLALGGLAVGLRLGDAGLAGDGGGVGPAEVLDVAGGVVDLLDLQRVDDEAELLHLGARRLAGERGELLAVADHLLHGHVADDGAQVAGEHVVHAVVHLVLLVEEAPGRVGDRREVVADLEDHHALDAERDALVGDAVDGQLGLAQVEREAAHLWTPGMTSVPLPVTILKPRLAVRRWRRGVVWQAGDDQRLVRLGHPPHELEQDDEERRDPAADHTRMIRPVFFTSLRCYIGVTTTVRGG